ncbi:MAG: 2TM domain-containing protein [Candidatus Bathyarchaeota archaeon]|nr:2TM domain-containing protein [Candidatus Bathyarchaeota archaeon]
MSLEDFKRAWREIEIEEAHKGFMVHLAAYVIVNGFLVFVNLYASPGYLWFPWILAGWGIGLAFHFVFSRSRFVVSDWEEKVAKIESRVKKSSSSQ